MGRLKLVKGEADFSKRDTGILVFQDCRNHTYVIDIRTYPMGTKDSTGLNIRLTSEQMAHLKCGMDKFDFCSGDKEWRGEPVK